MRFKKVVFYIAAAVIVIAAVIFYIRYKGKISRIISPFLMTIPLVYIIKPLAERLASKKINISLSILLVYFFFISALAAVCIFFIPELASNMRELMETLPQLIQDYEKVFNNLLSAIKTSNWSEQVKTAIFKEIEAGMGTLQKILFKSLENGVNMIVETIRFIVDFTIAFVITYYIIKDGEKFRDYFLLMLPRRWRNGMTGICKEIGNILAGFIQGQLMTALIVGILETMGLMIIKMKYSLVLGMVGGLANVIPYFGPYIGLLPALAIALTVSPMKAVWTIVIFMGVQQIDNNFISPKMIEGKLGLHPVATIFAVLVGGEFFGILGMLLAVPVLAIMRVLVNKTVEAIAQH
ncbi:MAG TPA: AI-2E family transporter [Clostridia bacterium]|nr:AI-2E family transporter [Clostridia bacterium]